MQEEVPIRFETLKVIVIDDDNEQPPIEKILMKPEMEDENRPAVQEYVFQLPYNKSMLLLIFSATNITQQLKKQQEIQLHQVVCEVSDGQQWNIEVSLDPPNATTVTFFITFHPIGEGDDSKAYKFQGTVSSKGFKRRKEVKKTLDEKQKYGGYGISVPLNNLGEWPVCLELEITVETSPKYNSRDEVGYTGLVNVSSLCYMNSVFQILFHLTEFRRLVFQINDLGDLKEFPATLQGLFYSMMTQRSSVSTQEIIRSFKWDFEQQTIQHDVHEFTMELLKGIQKKLEGKKHLATQIQQLFEGVLENHIEGITQRFDKVNAEEFMDIQLPVEGYKNLRQAFENFGEKELLAGDNAVMTDEFGRQSAYKYHLFRKLPPVLFVNLRRYKYDFETQGLMKINDQFEYSDTIDLSPFMVQKQNKQIYKLFGVMVHRGELINVGHYYCFIRTEDGTWLKFDDRVVTRASNQQVFQNNFGGTYETGEFNVELGQVILTTQRSPETAYMLVYICEEKWHDLLKPINQEEIPGWIQEKEVEITKKIELKNYIQIQLVIADKLNDFDFDPDGKRNGLLYHKRAPNAQIDIEYLQNQVDKNSVITNFPKNFSSAQTVDYLSHLLKTDVDVVLYKITTLKPNIESVQHIVKGKKPLNQILSNRVNFKCLIVFPKDPKVSLLPIYQGFSPVVEYMTESILSQDQEEKEQCLVLYRDFSKQMELVSFRFVDLNTSIDDLQLQDGFFLDQCSIYQQFNLIQQVKDLLAQFKSTYLTVLYEAKESTRWVQWFSKRREVVLKNQQTQQQFVRLFSNTDDYWDIVRAITEKEDYAQNHIIIKSRGKKGAPMIVKAPTIDNDSDQESSEKKQQKPKQKQESIEDYIQFDNQLIYLYSPVSVFDLKTQFAISYDVFNSQEKQSYENVICSKDTLIDDLKMQALGQHHLDILLKSTSGNHDLIVPLFTRKKSPLDIQIGIGCKYSLSRLKGQYSIAFTNAYSLICDQDQHQIYVVVKSVSKEGYLIAPPIVFHCNTTINATKLIQETIKLLPQIDYAEETYQLLENEVVAISGDGKQQRRMKQDLTIFFDYDGEEKFLEQSLQESELKAIFPAVEEPSQKQQLSVGMLINFNAIQDQRSQKLRQQGVCLNL